MNQQSDEAAWQSLGFERHDVEAIAANVIATLDLWKEMPESPDTVSDWTFNVYLWGGAVFALGALGYTVEHPQLSHWREVGERVIAAMLHYFFGPWRDRFQHFAEVLDRSQARLKLPWISYYRSGLAVAVSLSDWAAADRLLEWPGHDLSYDEGLDDRTPEDNAYQIWLALRVRGERGEEADAQRDVIERRSRRRPKMLAAAADSLLDADVNGLTKALTMYLKHYREREIHPRQVIEGICFDGTVLWHLARHRGLGEIPLPAELMMLIARP